MFYLVEYIKDTKERKQRETSFSTGPTRAVPNVQLFNYINCPWGLEVSLKL